VTRLRRIADRDRIFFVTTNLRLHTPVLSSTERDLVLRQLTRQHAAGEFLLFAYVIMPSHVHLLIAPKAPGLIAVIREFKSRVSQQLARTRGTRAAIWQPRDKLEYIHENPMEAGLVKRKESWMWSSAADYAQPRRISGLIDPIDLPVDRHAWLRMTP